MVSVRRGDVFWVRFDPAAGSEQKGVRPGVVIQNDAGNRYSPNTIVGAVTTKFASKPYPFIVALPEGALPRRSALDCAQIRTVDKARLQGAPIAHLDAAAMCAVDDAIRASLGLH
ncbi:MAG TPA: type II toxin-antitoxin system PemK/MazF family toxin [Coriobacteriia bacterium]